MTDILEINLTSFPDRPSWLAARLGGVGASESAALFGLSPWHSRFSLWAEKTGLAPPVELDEEWLEWGLLLEEPIAQRYARRTERRIWKAGEYAIAQHPRLPFMRATPDRWVIEAPDRDTRGVLQIKNSGAFKAGDWYGGVPDFIQAQVQHELAVTGFTWGSVAVLIGGTEFRYFDLERNEDYIAELEHACTDFWGTVERREQPPVDRTKATEAALKRLHPLDDGSAVHLGAEIAELYDELRIAKGFLKEMEWAERGLQNEIRAAMGESTFGLLPDGRLLSLKHQTISPHTVQHTGATFRVLREEKTPKARFNASLAPVKGAKAA
jgi:putative phage-type endonuclease